MTLLEQYQQSESWSEKITLMELFHLGKRTVDKYWTLNDTARYFYVSIGLASENLKLAAAIHSYPFLLKCESRQKALNRLSQLDGV